jgi:hypothetical protein
MTLMKKKKRWPPVFVFAAVSETPSHLMPVVLSSEDRTIGSFSSDRVADVSAWLYLNPSGMLEVGGLQIRAMTVAALFAAHDCLKILLLDNSVAEIVDLESAVQSLNISVIRLLDIQFRSTSSDRSLAANRSALLQLDRVFWFLSTNSNHLTRQIWIEGAIPVCEEMSAATVGFAAARGVRDELIVQLGVTLNEITGPNGDLWLNFIKKAGGAAAIRRLILAGANIEQKDAESRTGLLITSLIGDFEIAKLIIDAGADIEASDDLGATALILAAFLGHLEIVKLIIGAGADIEAKTNSGTTGLILAAFRGHLEIVDCWRLTCLWSALTTGLDARKVIT